MSEVQVEKVTQTTATAITVNQCAWWQKPDPAAGGDCRFSGMGVVQTVFNLPAKVVENQLVLLPAALVPVAGLAINAAVWYFVGRWALGKVWK